MTNGSEQPNKSKKKRGRGRPKAEVEMARFTFYMPVELAEKISAYAYWERMPISAVLTLACNAFFESKRVKPRPRTKTIQELLAEGKR